MLVFLGVSVAAGRCALLMGRFPRFHKGRRFRHRWRGGLPGGMDGIDFVQQLQTLCCIHKPSLNKTAHAGFILLTLGDVY
jgi:hypothetical protein